MTYNWNTMVEITVPTGTNGWLYSGEVIINGVKVRFPVGVPTSVPEPAAVLLKKMIELEQEEDANTAKPQNHYVGDVTIPAGKTLTLEKGSKLVDNSSPSEVVILPETVVTVDDGMAQITLPPNQMPEVGATVRVTYNGVDYDCTVVYMNDDGEAYLMGNTEHMGVPGGNANAPFVVAFMPDHIAGESGVYGMVMPMDGATSVTLSIVQTEGASADSGSGGGESMVFTTMVTRASDGTVTLDKSYDELVAAYKAGKFVKAMIDNGGMTLTLPAVSLNQDSGNDNLYFSLYMKISSSMSMWASLSYDNKNGTITYDGGY